MSIVLGTDEGKKKKMAIGSVRTKHSSTLASST